MMGTQKSEPQLFHYAVNLEKRVRANHPVREVKAVVNFSFAREEVARCYGRNGNESVPPKVIFKKNGKTSRVPTGSDLQGVLPKSVR